MSTKTGKIISNLKIVVKICWLYKRNEKKPKRKKKLKVIQNVYKNTRQPII